MHIASSIIYSLKSSPIDDIILNKNITNLVALLRTISSMIVDRIVYINSEELMSHFVFNSIFAKYGLRDLTETKFIGLLSSVVKFKYNYRVNSFG